MKNKGFTLVELLATLVILAVLGLITIPIVGNIISDSKKKAGLESAQSYLRATEQYIIDAETDDSKKEKLDNNLFGIIDIQGSKAKKGIIYVDEDKEVDFKLIINDFCYIKNHELEDIAVFEEKNCMTPIEMCFRTEDDDEYDNSVTITDYMCGDSTAGIIGTGFNSRIEYADDGDYSVLEIPSTIDGKTVVGIDTGAFSHHRILFDALSYSPGERLRNNLGKRIKAQKLAIRQTISNNIGIKKLKLPNTIKYISKYAFAGNEIESIEIPEGVLYIGDYAFAFNKLTSINIPSSILELGYGCFNGNMVPDDQAFISNLCDENDDGILTSDEIHKSDIISYAGKNKNVVIPNYVTSILDGAFQYEGIEIVVFPSTLQQIGYESFSGNNLKEVLIPNSVTSIDEDAFKNNSLTSFNIDNTSSFINNSEYPWGIDDTSVIHFLRGEPEL